MASTTTGNGTTASPELKIGLGEEAAKRLVDAGITEASGFGYSLPESLREATSLNLAREWINKTRAGQPPKGDGGSWRSGEVSALETVLHRLPKEKRLEMLPQFLGAIEEVAIKDFYTALKLGEVVAKSCNGDGVTTQQSSQFSGFLRVLTKTISFGNNPSSYSYDVSLAEIKRVLKDTQPEDQKVATLIETLIGRSREKDLPAITRAARFLEIAGESPLLQRLRQEFLDDRESRKALSGTRDGKELMQKEIEMLAARCLDVESATTSDVMGKSPASALCHRVLGAMHDQLLPELTAFTPQVREALLVSILWRGTQEEISEFESKLGFNAQGIATRVISRALSEFDLVRAATIKKKYGIEPDAEQIKVIEQQLNQSIEAQLAKSEFHAAGQEYLRLAAFKHFIAHGCTLTHETISSTQNLEPNYGGKVMLFAVGDRFVARGFYYRPGSRSEMHADIRKGFEEELELRGLAGIEVQEAGGAHISIPADTTRPITIEGKSEDFGECNKAVLREIMAKAYPGREVILGNGRY